MNGVGLVVVLPPVVNDFPGMKNIAEPVFIQAFIPKASVETLNNCSMLLPGWISGNSTPCSKAH
jgi:hypothetical protein